MVIDLSPMKRLEIDPNRAWVRLQSGVLAGELDLATNAFSMAVPLGSCPSVGVAGYALGGGESALTPKLGFACDNITSVEIITADGQILRADADENPDLFWAVRGGSGNFGTLRPRSTFGFIAIGKRTRRSSQVSDPSRARGAALPQSVRADHSRGEALPPRGGAAVSSERMLDIAVVWNGDES